MDSGVEHLPPEKPTRPVSVACSFEHVHLRREPPTAPVATREPLPRRRRSRYSSRTLRLGLPAASREHVFWGLPALLGPLTEDLAHLLYRHDRVRFDVAVVHQLGLQNLGYFVRTMYTPRESQKPPPSLILGESNICLSPCPRSARCGLDCSWVMVSNGFQVTRNFIAQRLL